jgi:hypothetical protein
MPPTEKMEVLEIRKKIALNKFRDYLFWVLGLLSTLVGFVVLFTLIVDLFMDGFPRLAGNLISYPSVSERAGSYRHGLERRLRWSLLPQPFH